eukprot:350066-Chlamydomonas_euryale.AAC.10
MCGCDQRGWSGFGARKAFGAAACSTGLCKGGKLMAQRPKIVGVSIGGSGPKNGMPVFGSGR